MKYTNLILIIFLLLACNNRNNSDNELNPKLPPETQVGANTFGCIVNGKLFYPRDGTPSIGSNPKGVEFMALGNYPNYIYRELLVNNYKDGKPINYFNMHFHQFKGQLGIYNWKKTNYKTGIDGNENDYLIVRAFDYNDNTWKWYGSYENSGHTTITKYENGVFSVQFSGKLRTENGISEIEITNGRFDFNLFTLPNKEWP
jgi:hypothetical protein